MNLTYSSDEQDLADLARQVFETFNPEILQEVAPQDVVSHSTKLMTELANAGLFGIGFDESVGGSGGSLFDMGIVFREAGRTVAPTVFRSTIGAALLIDTLGTDAQRKSLIPHISSGELLASIAFAESGIELRTDLMTTTAVRDAEGWRINGTKTHVENASTAGAFVVAALTDGDTSQELQYLVVPAGADGLTISAQQVIGEEDQGRLEFSDVLVGGDALLGEDPARDSLPLAARSELAFDALRNLEMVGIAERVLQRTTEYVSTRHQFGRPIGTFQAVQHRVADMATSTRAAGYLAHSAAWRLSQGLDAESDVVAATIWAGKTAEQVTLAAHQVHAGLGYARESSLYLWSQRAKSLSLQCGSRGRQLRHLASLVFSN